MQPAPRGTRQLATWLDWQEAAHPKAWDLGLERIRAVWQRLGAPRIAEHILTTAGTNGKGSCVAWTEEICRTHGVSVASFSSPHLLDYRERIRFDGEMVDGQDLCAAFDAVDEARKDISLTYFEWSALAAFWLMAARQPTVAVLEVGLGGRLDAVNLLDADAVIFTRIGLDHQDWLGETIAEIAREKAGVLRPGQAVAFADHQPPKELLQAAQSVTHTLWYYDKTLRAKNRQHRLHITLPEASFDLPLPEHMPGEHQYGHLCAVMAILRQWFPLNPAALSQAMRQTRNPARLMVREGRPRYVIDVAHNADSAEVLASFLHTIRRPDGGYHIVCGMLKDKDHRAIFQQLDSLATRWYLCALPGARGSNGEALSRHAEQAGIDREKIRCFDQVSQGLASAQQAAKANDTIVVMGSFVTVTDVLTQWSIDE